MQTTEFKASNGYILQNKGGLIRIKDDMGVSTLLSYDFLNSADQTVLREFFRHERDEELGRWRWPENPDYVVYPDGTSRTVNKESNGRVMVVSLHDRASMTTWLDSYVGAAKAYDAAHPLPKPWENAKQGEVWLFKSVHNEKAHPFIFQEDNMWVNKEGKLLDYVGNQEAHPYGRSLDKGFTPHRIWPEA